MRVLIVEDEAEIASFIKKGLEAEGYSVDAAGDGKKGLDLARINDYDLIVLDIMLPEKDGLEVCRELRKEKTNVLVLILSVKSDSSVKVEALDAGADDYLTKPFSFEELLARIRALQRRGKTIMGPKLKVEDLEMDTAAHKVFRAGKLINLSKKEFSLLEYLMRNQGVVLTRAMILEHVWDMNADPFTNTVDVHIMELRDKIDEGHRKKFIQTVRGTGYKIE